MKKVLKSVVAVVLCLAMVLSLAACGPKYTNGVNTDEFTDKATGVTYKGRIKIGAAIARSGAYALVGEPYGGFYDLYVRYINEFLGGVAKTRQAKRALSATSWKQPPMTTAATAHKV